MAEYTERIDGFQIRDVAYWGAPPIDAPIRYDIVKWVQTEPREVYSVEQRKYIKSTEYCYSVGFLEYNAHEPCFEFQSVGLRWLECQPTQRVIDMILEFAEKKEKEIEERREE